jgi:hypothetical protein
MPSHDPGHVAARLIITAARSLCSDSTVFIADDRCRAVAEALTRALAVPHARRADILDASPSIFDPSGRIKTLVEMIEEEDGDDAAKLRLARLLLRAIEWR